VVIMHSTKNGLRLFLQSLRLMKKKLDFFEFFIIIVFVSLLIFGGYHGKVI
jgi:hypothetical protein